MVRTVKRVSYWRFCVPSFGLRNANWVYAMETVFRIGNMGEHSLYATVQSIRRVDEKTESALPEPT